MLKNVPKPTGKGCRKRYPRLAAGCESSAVGNLLHCSRVFHGKTWQRYLIKLTSTGPLVWEVKWAVFWRKDESGLPTRRHCLLVARNVLTHEIKYFVSNRVPGERNLTTGQTVSVRWLLRVAFGRWSIESCFREGKEELGLDHFEARGWRCVHRHYYVTALSHLFCARMRAEFDAATDESVRMTVEQIRSATNVWLASTSLCPSCQRHRYRDELDQQHYYQARSEQARVSHRPNPTAEQTALGNDFDRHTSRLSRDQPY